MSPTRSNMRVGLGPKIMSKYTTVESLKIKKKTPTLSTTEPIKGLSS